MLNRRTFIGTVGKLAAIAGLAPVVKAGEAKEVEEHKPYLAERKYPIRTKTELVQYQMGIDPSVSSGAVVECKIGKDGVWHRIDPNMRNHLVNDHRVQIIPAL